MKSSLCMVLCLVTAPLTCLTAAEAEFFLPETPMGKCPEPEAPIEPHLQPIQQWEIEQFIAQQIADAYKRAAVTADLTSHPKHTLLKEKIVTYLQKQLDTQPTLSQKQKEMRQLVIAFFKKTPATDLTRDTLAAYEEKATAIHEWEIGEKDDVIQRELESSEESIEAFHALYTKLLDWDEKGDFSAEEHQQITQFLESLITSYCANRQQAGECA